MVDQIIEVFGGGRLVEELAELDAFEDVRDVGGYVEVKLDSGEWLRLYEE